MNTLMASLYNYVMQCVNDPDEAFYVKHNNIVHNFLWDGKKAKVPMELLLCTKFDGGLKLVNLCHKIASLKIQWVFREDSRLQELITGFVPATLGTIFWDCTINPKVHNIAVYLPAHIPLFWIEVINHWFQYTWMPELNQIQKVLWQVIWLNTHVTVNAHMILYEKAAQRGLLYIRDL